MAQSPLLDDASQRERDAINRPYDEYNRFKAQPPLWPERIRALAFKDVSATMRGFTLTIAAIFVFPLAFCYLYVYSAWRALPETVRNLSEYPDTGNADARFRAVTRALIRERRLSRRFPYSRHDSRHPFRPVRNRAEERKKSQGAA